MTDLLSCSKVRELQAMLFPVQPIPGSALTSLQTPHESQVLERCRILNESIESTLFSGSLDVTRHRQSKETLRVLSNATSQYIVDDIVQEVARWPTECQVIPERVRHIDYNPESPEPFYLSTGKEPTPKPIDDELGTVLFRYCPTNVTNYFSRSCAGGNPILASSNKTFKETSTECTLPSFKDPESDSNIFFVTEISKNADTNSDLQFESRFESGNLGKVVKITDTYYQLYLRRDLYTQRHTQWYYFQISNTRSRITYRLSIVNMCKDESLYNEGLRPLLYSTEDARTRSIGWRRCGDNISYYKNGESDEDKEKHTLTFNISFPHDHDIVYLAHCYPYTYTDLQEYLGKIVSDPIKSRFTKLRLLCRTLAGNGVYYLTITAPTYDEEVRRKRGVVITARVHPGETPSSWTMKGIIDFLTGESNRAKELRERFVFKLIPMLNPDGVIVGNNRCSLSGKDLNRQYRTVMRESYPSVWHTKLMIRRLLEECGVTIYCDLHAHSRKHNIFAYGCESKRAGCNGRLSEQIFPLMLHKNAADKFSFENCKFHVEKGKEGTGRVVAWSMGVQNSYTMEASMGGSRLGSRSGTHFSTQDYEQIGKAFCETLLDFSDQDPTKERLRSKILARLIKEGSNAEEPTNIDLTDYSSDEGDSSESHASDESMSNAYEESRNDDHPIYAPPPSPNFGSTGSVNLLKRRIRTREMERKYLERRKFLQSRAVMDLHTTDPGSDLCYTTDWPDDDTKRGGISARIQRHVEGVGTLVLPGKDEEIKKDERTVERSLLPAIIRPRSVSLGENLLPDDEDRRKIEQRARCHRISRIPKQYPCAASLISRDVKTKVSSFRQQIWMGIPIRNAENGEPIIDNDFRREPLSWGISSLALASCNSKSEILLSSCTEKLRSLEYLEKTTKELRKTKKKLRRKQNLHLEEIKSRAGDVQENVRREDKEKVTKKKRSRLKWQMAVNLSSTIKDNKNVDNSEKTAFLSVKADSLKLLSTNASAKKERRQQKSETRGKSQKYNMVAATERILARNKITKIRTIQQLKSFTAQGSDSSNSEDGMNNGNNNTRKLKNGKRKQKKKKQLKKTRTPNVAGNKKRATSAKIVKKSMP